MGNSGAVLPSRGNFAEVFDCVIFSCKKIPMPLHQMDPNRFLKICKRLFAEWTGDLGSLPEVVGERLLDVLACVRHCGRRLKNISGWKELSGVVNLARDKADQPDAEKGGFRAIMV